MRILDQRLRNGSISREAGGWTTIRSAQTERSADAAKLLSDSAEPRPGNLRWAIDGHQEVHLLGEIRDADGLLNLSPGEELFTENADAAKEVSPDELSWAFAETGYEWAQSPDESDGWQATAMAPSGQRCELIAKAVRNGVEVESRIAEWKSELGATSQAALAHFLASAHSCLRCVRFGICRRGVSVSSFATFTRLEVELVDSVKAIVAASRLVGNEVRALADDAVARMYLKVTMESGDREVVTKRL